MPEIPHLKKVYAASDKKEFVLVGISRDGKVEALNPFIEKEKMQWPQILDQGEPIGALGKLHNVWGIPQTYLIDRDGKIAAKGLRGEHLEEAVAKLLGQPRK